MNRLKELEAKKRIEELRTQRQAIIILAAILFAYVWIVVVLIKGLLFGKSKSTRILSALGLLAIAIGTTVLVRHFKHKNVDDHNPKTPTALYLEMDEQSFRTQCASFLDSTKLESITPDVRTNLATILVFRDKLHVLGVSDEAFKESYESGGFEGLFHEDVMKHVASSDHNVGHYSLSNLKTALDKCLAHIEAPDWKQQELKIRACLYFYLKGEKSLYDTIRSADGDGAYLAMEDALSMAHLSAADIQYVNAHGTGTPNNDLSESKALLRVFGDKMPEVSSTKSFTGHTTSASGSIETVICLLAMQHGFTPGNLGWKNQIEGGITPTHGHNGVKLDHVLCNSFGFGGNDSSLVLSKCDEPFASEHYPNMEVVELACDEVTTKEELVALKEFVSPMESRRMSKLMKAAILSAFRALKKAGIETPDAIITATSRGMLEFSQRFLDDIINNGEEMLKPTLFMQSTHNTLGSEIAIRCKCHGYNITYSCGDDSEKWAMRDAVRQLKTGKARSVLVGCFDESTFLTDSICKKSGKPVYPEIFAVTRVLVSQNNNK